MEQNKIVYISTAQLEHHPDNPRFAVGDVSELAESLKAKGCLQNLTVVKKGYSGLKYLVVIGNRRLEAAKLAGIAELPCVVSNMTRQECVETMLIENMQRQDLTPWEEARGIQMMIDDFGCSVADISQKTGLSDSTVRRRRKLLDLDETVMGELDQLVKKGQRQILLDDYLDVAELENDLDRVKVLKSLGTANFNFEMQTAKRKQTEQKNLAILKTKLLDAGYVELGTIPPIYTYVTYVMLNSTETLELPELPEGTKGGFHYPIGYRYINLYRTYTEAEKRKKEKQTNPSTASGSIPLAGDADKAEERKKDLQERLDKLRELSRTAYMCRRNFVLNCYPSKDEHIKAIVEMASRTIFNEEYIDPDELFSLYGLKDEEDDEVIENKIEEAISDKPYHSLLLMLYSCYDDNCKGYFYANATHFDNARLSPLYDFLKMLGYEMSDEEKQLRDGTHPLFVKEDE